MRSTIRKISLGLVLATGFFSLASAQQAPTVVQQSATELRAATAAVSSATSAGVLTITPPGSQYVYISGVDITNCAGAAAVVAAAPSTISTTNLTGAPAYTVGSGTTAGACQPTVSLNYSGGLKSTTPGTPVTYTLPAFATNQTIRVNVYYYTGL